MTERELSCAEVVQKYQGCKNEFKEISQVYGRGCLGVFMPWARIKIPETTHRHLIALEGTLETIANSPEVVREAKIAEEDDTECFLDEIVELYKKIERYELKCRVVSTSVV
ncbi:MAG: hypothetical protein Q7K43_01585 [Candidatus Woesearchaeota archaeon]|nr:hypothetical protein [Candidatus Woesearchaeota archaeon]